jgi:hypothetical protein
MADRTDWVGPVLEAGAVGEAVVEAIREENARVVVNDRGSYLRVLSPGSCTVTRKAIEVRLGAPFELPGALERVMPAFKGRLILESERAEWTVIEDWTNEHDA